MTVEVVNLQGGGSSLIKLFTDTLLAPDQPLLVGNDWLTCQMDLPPLTGNMDQLAARVNRGVTGLNFNGGGGGSILFQTVSLPAPLNYQAVWGKQQFSELEFVSDTSAGVNCNAVGACVWAQPNGKNGYCFLINRTGITDGSIGLVAGPTGQGASGNLGAVHAIVAGDKCRISIERGVGTNVIKLWINGVVLETINDNSMTEVGLPGISIPVLFAGGQITIWKNYRGGFGEGL